MDIASIAADRVHGASFLTARAAEVLLAILNEGGDWNRAAVDIVRAQPAMASIFSLANRALLADDPRAVLEDELGSAARRVEQAAERASASIRSDGVYLTHSYSSCVERTFVAARRRGTPFRVIATESRPLREGVTLSRALVERGIPVRVVADAAVYRMMPEVTAVFVGADAMTPDGVVNKIGTSLVALAAREFRRPVYVVCTENRVVGVRLPADRLRAPDEIVPERIAGLSVSNYYFDTTPREWIDAVMTEAGPCNHCQPSEIHPALQEVLR